MFICSVSTVIFNANPLLRYDGYYILADLVEIPNLRQKATTILSRKLGEWCLGLEPPDDPFLPAAEPGLLRRSTRSPRPSIAGWSLFSILWFLYQVFKPYGLEIDRPDDRGWRRWSGWSCMPLYKVGKFFYVPGRLDKVKKPRMYASLGVLAAVLLARAVRAAAAQRDLPRWRSSPATPRRSTSTWPTAAGSTRCWCSPGRPCRPGQIWPS